MANITNNGETPDDVDKDPNLGLKAVALVIYYQKVNIVNSRSTAASKNKKKNNDLTAVAKVTVLTMGAPERPFWYLNAKARGE